MSTADYNTFLAEGTPATATPSLAVAAVPEPAMAGGVFAAVGLAVAHRCRRR